MEKLIHISILTLLFCGCVANGEGNSEFKGVDHEGKERSCKPMAGDVACTEIFTPADAYGLKCKEEGHKAIQCGCHDWICVKN